MSSRGGDATGVEDDDLVCFDHGGQPMGDDHYGAADGCGTDGMVHRAFVASVEAGVRFIEQQEWRVTDQCPGDRQALALSSG